MPTPDLVTEICAWNRRIKDENNYITKNARNYMECSINHYANSIYDSIGVMSVQDKAPWRYM